MIWFPVHKEDRYLNFIAFGVVFLLLALGFEILKLPAQLAPPHSPLLQIMGLCAFLVLNSIIIWMAARDDFIRPRYGLPRAAATLLILTLASTAAFLIRGLLNGSYVTAIGEPINIQHAIAIMIGGQVVISAFMAVFFLKKTDTAKVREFKRHSKAIRSFMKDWLFGEIRDPVRFGERYRALADAMKKMPETAIAAGEVVWEREAEYARLTGAFFAEVHQYIFDMPDASIMKGGAAFVEGREDMVKTLLGEKALKRIKSRAVD